MWGKFGISELRVGCSEIMMTSLLVSEGFGLILPSFKGGGYRVVNFDLRCRILWSVCAANVQ
jgi:hypothetical protein